MGAKGAEARLRIPVVTELHPEFGRERQGGHVVAVGGDQRVRRRQRLDEPVPGHQDPGEHPEGGGMPRLVGQGPPGQRLTFSQVGSASAGAAPLGEERGGVGEVEGAPGVPLRPRQAVVRSMVREFVDRVFDGSARPLLVHLVKDKGLTERERRALQKLLDEEGA